MGDLSKNFSRHEFECKCGCGFDRVNAKLVKTLQTIRDVFGHPLFISSGCRCPIHNQCVGGVWNSQHTLGKAADIYWHGDVCQLYDLIYDLLEEGDLPDVGYIQLYKDKNFVHIDVRDEPANFPRVRC